MIHVISLDHLVLTVKSIEATAAFYSQLGFKRENFGDGRVALRFGQQKINLHQQGREIAPNARIPVPGSADLCFLVRTPPMNSFENLKVKAFKLNSDRLKELAQPQN